MSLLLVVLSLTCSLLDACVIGLGSFGCLPNLFQRSEKQEQTWLIVNLSHGMLVEEEKKK